MNAEKLAMIKFHVLSYVIILTFDTAKEANNLAETEGLKMTIIRDDGTATARIYN